MTKFIVFIFFASVSVMCGHIAGKFLVRPAVKFFQSRFVVEVGLTKYATDSIENRNGIIVFTDVYGRTVSTTTEHVVSIVENLK